MASQAEPVEAKFRAAFEAAAMQNKKDLEDLARRGVQFDPATLIIGQIESLYDTIGEAMGPVEGPRFRALARLRWEQRIAEEIAKTQEQGHKSQLALGGSFTPGMIRELAKATNTFGSRP